MIGERFNVATLDSVNHVKGMPSSIHTAHSRSVTMLFIVLVKQSHGGFTVQHFSTAAYREYEYLPQDPGYEWAVLA